MTAAQARRPSPRLAPEPSQRATAAIAAAVLVVLGLWAYAPSFSGVFVFDDLPAIARNPHVRSLRPLRAAAAPPDTTVAGRPVASLTLALNYALAPRDAREVFVVNVADPSHTASAVARNARGYHAMNLLIHLATALALFGVIRRTLVVWRLPMTARGAAGFALASSAIWVVHPLTTGAVTYIVQRVESLMALWYLLTLYCAIRAHGAAPGDGSGRRLWKIAAIVACALGMATKETMASAPIAVALWGWIARRRASRAPATRAWAQFCAALCVTWLILIVLVSSAPRGASVGWHLAGWSPWSYLLTQSEVLLWYLRLVIVPSPLILDYGWPPATLLGAFLPFVVCAAAVAATIALAIRRRPAAFPLAIFFLVLAPSSSILPVASEIAAEHRMYLPLAAVIVLVIAATRWASRRALGATASSTRRLAVVAVILVALIVGALGMRTRARSRDYASAETLWQLDIASQPAHARPRVSYGMALFAAERFREAETQFTAALALEPTNVLALVNLGSLLCAQGRLDDCRRRLEAALAVEPGHPDALATLGDLHLARRDPKAAAPLLARALDARPDDVLRLNRLGWLLATTVDDDVRDGHRALTLAQKAVLMTDRQDVMSLNTLAAALAEVGQFAQAAAAMREAMAVAAARQIPGVATELDRRLQLYLSGKRLRE
jgi:protein O-mannosyl-transferase